jgi:DNA-binding transcriptional ArsR family regulator
MTTSNVNPPDDSPTGNRRGDDDRLDALFDVLADARRRRVLRVLAASEGDEMAVDALVETLVYRDPGDPTPDRLRVSLHHVHLPKLDAADAVDYAPDCGQVRYQGSALLEDLLDRT